jgi:hypothetical protein
MVNTIIYLCILNRNHTKCVITRLYCELFAVSLNMAQIILKRLIYLTDVLWEILVVAHMGSYLLVSSPICLMNEISHL